MSEPILCKICSKRRARRACPAVHGDICAICCGTEREVSLSCPLECEYLQEAHRREKPHAVSEDRISYPDVVVNEEILRTHEELLHYCVFTLVHAGLQTSGAIDSDIMSALEAVIQTHRTLESGLVYETKPENTVALAVQRSFAASLADYQELRVEREPLAPVRNSDMLAFLVLMHRFGQQNQNGRPRGRMFLDLLHQMTPEASVEESSPSIII